MAVKKAYEQDVITGIEKVGTCCIAYIDDLFDFYNSRRTKKEIVTEAEFMALLWSMEKRRVVTLIRGRDVQLGHRGFLRESVLYASVMLLDNC